MAEDRFLVVGLGNPGPKYAATRHNAGFLVVDELGRRAGGNFKSHKANADVLEGRLEGIAVVLAKPKSFMNVSGGPVKALAQFYKIEPDHIVVVHDELDLPFAGLRLKSGGGEGGHNGLKSTTASLGTRDYARVRFGIGRPPGRQDPAEFVLREFAAAERKDLDFLVDRAADAVEAILTGGVEAAQNHFNA
ncbi:aminoacyl-tRNA hydrolase [Jatrophihabitans telluris]|uniref:Peptidyl-tRNA hydrolase n=1 Tax=Jatrophihabitans telluris TaxID=2038343 RepID=A0ABY4R1K7_9ACTN|nr:aminoacyl-tRNA hydrolase [Jatrophihabitans telluris]UQX89347.1 aminoacyl-tRNA hydrolase [Jatrophihabitans telluris]